MYNKNTKNCIYFSNVLNNVNKSLNKIFKKKINYKFNFKNVVKMFINHEYYQQKNCVTLVKVRLTF